MSTDGKRVLALVTAVAVIALAAVIVSIATAARNNNKAQTEAATEPEVTTGEVQESQLRKVTNNKGKSAPGMCVYDAEKDELTFKNVPKGNMDENDPVLNEIDKGGQFADSQADCDELNALRANPPKEDHDSDLVEVAADPNVPDVAGPPPGAPAGPPPEAIEALKAFEKRHGNGGKAGEPKQ